MPRAVERETLSDSSKVLDCSWFATDPLSVSLTFNLMRSVKRIPRPVEVARVDPVALPMGGKALPWSHAASPIIGSRSLVF